MTNQRKPAGRKGKAAPEKNTVVIPMVLSDDPAEVEELAAKHIPGWDQLNVIERAEVVGLMLEQRGWQEPLSVSVTTKPGGQSEIELAGRNQTLTYMKLLKTFQARSIEVVNARANDLLRYLGSVGSKNTGAYNAALSFIESMEPRDQAEALLLVQMYATHDAAMRALSQLGNAGMLPELQTYGNIATKLLRASQAQMETLSRMRRGGEQIVKHIHVDNRGGQAIVADQVVTGGQNGNVGHQAHGLAAALPGPDPLGDALSAMADQGQEALQTARRPLNRSAEG